MKAKNSMSPILFKKEKTKQEDLSVIFKNELHRLGILSKIGYVQEHKFHPVRRWRFDFAWIDEMVAVECDGGQWRAGGGRHNTDADREKINTAAFMGWTVFRFSGTQLKNDPLGCVSIVEKTIFNKRIKQG